MKMWKIALAGMLLATSAFGATTLKLSDTTLVDPLVVAPGTASVQLQLDGPNRPFVGFGVSLVAEQPGLVLTQVEYLSTVNVTNSTTWAVPLSLDAKTVDIGAGNTNPNADVPANTPLVMLTITLPSAEPGQMYKVSTADAYWYNAAFSEADYAAATADFIVSVVPEPASLSLLAIGAAFFARRRRA